MAIPKGAGALLAAVILQSGPALAQQGFVGQWICQTTFTEFNEFQTRTGSRQLKGT